MALRPYVCVPCAPTSRNWSAPQQKAAPWGVEKRRAAEYADARGALQTANGAYKPGGLSGNAWRPGLGA